MLGRFFHDADGATAIEYGLICACMTLALIGGLQATGTSVGDLYTQTLGLISAALG